MAVVRKREGRYIECLTIAQVEFFRASSIASRRHTIRPLVALLALGVGSEPAGGKANLLPLSSVACAARNQKLRRKVRPRHRLPTLLGLVCEIGTTGSDWQFSRARWGSGYMAMSREDPSTQGRTTHHGDFGSVALAGGLGSSPPVEGGLLPDMVDKCLVRQFDSHSHSFSAFFIFFLFAGR